MSELNHLNVPFKAIIECNEVLRLLDSGELEKELSETRISGAIDILDYAVIGARVINRQNGVGFSRWLDGLTTYNQFLKAFPSLKEIKSEEFEKKIRLYQLSLKQLVAGTLDRGDLRAELKDFFSSLRNYYDCGEYGLSSNGEIGLMAS